MTTLPGIDVSAIGQGMNFDWTAYTGRIAFAFIKATEGNTFKDPAYGHNIAAARGLGIVRGAYHVLHPDVPGAAQAEFYLSYADPEPGELVMVDVEITVDAAGNPVPPAKVAATVAAFVDTVRSATGAWPVTYVDRSLAAAGYVASAAMCPSFITNPDRLPIPNPIGPWRLVSFEQTGIRGVDTDVFYGDLPEMHRLTTTRKWTPAPAPAPTPAPATLPLELLAINVGHTYAPRQSLETVWLVSTDNGATYHRAPAAAAAAG